MIKLSDKDLQIIEAIQVVATNYQHSNKQAQKYIEKAADLLEKISNSRGEYYDWASYQMQAHEKLTKGNK